MAISQDERGFFVALGSRIAQYRKDSHITVSYTHLDVYKRQVFHLILTGNEGEDSIHQGAFTGSAR